MAATTNHSQVTFNILDAMMPALEGQGVAGAVAREILRGVQQHLKSQFDQAAGPLHGSEGHEERNDGDPSYQAAGAHQIPDPMVPKRVFVTPHIYTARKATLSRNWQESLLTGRKDKSEATPEGKELMENIAGIEGAEKIGIDEVMKFKKWQSKFDFLKIPLLNYVPNDFEATELLQIIEDALTRLECETKRG